MFRMVFPSITRSSRLHIQQQAQVKQLLLAVAVLHMPIFILGSPCIIYKFALFRFQPDTLIILYIYNLGFFIYLYMFRTNRSIIRRSNAFYRTSSLWHLSLGRRLSCLAFGVRFFLVSVLLFCMFCCTR
jgi:hypothetical protein